MKFLAIIEVCFLLLSNGNINYGKKKLKNNLSQSRRNTKCPLDIFSIFFDESYSLLLHTRYCSCSRSSSRFRSRFRSHSFPRYKSRFFILTFLSLACFCSRLFYRSFYCTLFKLFVLPHFDYFSTIYFGNVSKAVSFQIEKSFNKASKQVLNARSMDLIWVNSCQN